MKASTCINLCILLFLSNSIRPQETINKSSVEELFLEQISLFPQEKIYLQTDRNTYMPGDMIWFRVHLVDALLLKQANASRYVYLELINPAEQIVQRVKIRPDKAGFFYGQVQLDEELPEGNYTLRTYTRFMQNQGEAYFFNKPLHIVHQLSANISPVVNYTVNGDKIEAEIFFLDKTDGHKIKPEECIIYPEGDAEEKSKVLSFKDETTRYSFLSKARQQPKAFILKAILNGHEYSGFFAIPCPEQTFEVSFFPEGGYAPLSANIQMGFKAINTDGLSEEITGEIYDDRDELFGTFESLHLGMGSFRMYYSPGRKYYAVCTNKENVSKRFELPEASVNAVSLKTIRSRDLLRVALTHSPGYTLPAGTQLVAHIRGAVIYEQPWNEKQGYVAFEHDFFPAGIVHFLLIDADRNILSERLIFSYQQSTFAHTSVTFDKNRYDTRDKITMHIKITDENHEPLAANFALSVVDVNDVSIDTTSTLISTLLLTSELKGYIESPMSYLQPNNRHAAMALDALMMTQGWRRYNIPGILKGELTRELSYPVETGEEISGKADGIFSGLSEGGISLLAVKDSVIGTDVVEPEAKGKFVFQNLEYPEGTHYIIQALTKKGSKKVFLTMNPPPAFPAITISRPVMTPGKSFQDETHLSNMYQRYTIENGMRVYNLDEVLVTAKKKSKAKTTSPYYSGSASQVVSAEDIETWKLLSVSDLLIRIPGVSLRSGEVYYRNEKPMFIIDNIPNDDFDYNLLDINDVSDAFALPATSVSAIFGARASGGAIIINTKRGFVQKNKINSNIQMVAAAGYRQTVEFYSPVYETKQQKEMETYDLRSTIHWKPDVVTDETGTTTITFYSADVPSEYGVVIEGVSSLGHLIHTSSARISVR